MPTTVKNRFLLERKLVFVLLCSAFILAFFHRVAPTVIADELTASLHASALALGSIAAMYFYVYALMQVPAGIIVDLAGPRWSVGLATAVGGLGSILFGLAPDVLTANIARCIIGFGVAFAFVGAMRASAVWFRAEHYAMAGGWIILVGNLGAVLGTTPLAWSLAWVSWRFTFVAIGGLSLVLAVAILCFVRDKPSDSAYDQGPGMPSSAQFKQDLVACLKQPGVWLCFVAGFALVGTYFGFTGIWAVPYLQERAGLSKQSAADCLTFSLILLAVGAPLAGWASDRMQRRVPLIVLACIASAGAWITLAVAHGLGFWTLSLLLALSGLCCGPIVGAYATAKDLAPPAAAGFSVALVNTGLFAGAAILQLVIGWVISNFGADTQFLIALSGLAGVSLAGGVAAVFIPETHPGYAAVSRTNPT